MSGELPRVPGFRFSGVASGIKKRAGAPDLGLIVADAPCPVAAVFTRNLVRAAPVVVAAERVASGRAQAVLVNSGNANAGTGEGGLRMALRTTEQLAALLDVAPALVVPASTGVIGQPLPEAPFDEGLLRAVEALSERGAADFAEAIRTTDRWPKTAHATAALAGGAATVLGVAKGAGMIHPDMATTLGFVVTDAVAEPALLRRALRDAVETTFNRITVDGDTSTNDAIVLLASGASGAMVDEAHLPAFTESLRDVLGRLGRMIVADGEGARHVVEVRVTGAPDEAGAVTVARTIATSLLVKTALHGKDPNWGRILGAAGRAGVPFDPMAATVRLGDVPVYARGTPRDDVEEAASAVMAAAEYVLSVDLGAGGAEASYLTCDLGHDYVTLNADYRT